MNAWTRVCSASWVVDLQTELIWWSWKNQLHTALSTWFVMVSCMSDVTHRFHTVSSENSAWICQQTAVDGWLTLCSMTNWARWTRSSRRSSWDGLMSSSPRYQWCSVGAGRLMLTHQSPNSWHRVAWNVTVFVVSSQLRITFSTTWLFLKCHCKLVSCHKWRFFV